MAQAPKPTDPKSAAAAKAAAEREREEREEARADRRDDRHDARQEARVAMPGRPPQSAPVEGDDEPVSELTKAEQEAGKETLENFGEQLKAEQELGAKLVQQNADLAKSRLPKALPPPPSGPKANPLHG